MAACALRVTSGPAEGQTIEVDHEIVLGRDGADLTIEDAEMSRRHAAVRPVNGGVEIEDLGSTNGTFVNGRKIAGAKRLTSSGTMKVGTSHIQVEVMQPAVTQAREQVAAPQATQVSAAEAGPDVTAPRAVKAPPQPTVARARPTPPGPADDAEDLESDRRLAKLGLISMILSVGVGLPGIAHPQPEPGDDNPRAFLDTIVPSDSWSALHLTYYLSMAISVAFFLFLYRYLRRGAGVHMARLGYAFAIVAAAQGGVWMMLDGFAMKEIADDWAAAAGAERVAVEQAAFAIEHFILAMFSFNLAVWVGVTPLLFGVAILRDGRWPAVSGPAGVAVGALGIVIGIVQMFTERTALVTHILVPILYILFALWLVSTTLIWYKRTQAA